jgi:hypothetical protein
VGLEHLDRVGLDQLRQRVDGVLEVQELALARLLLPLGRVAVAVEDDRLGFLDHLGQQLADGAVERLATGGRLFELAGDVGQ